MIQRQRAGGIFIAAVGTLLAIYAVPFVTFPAFVFFVAGLALVGTGVWLIFSKPKSG